MGIRVADGADEQLAGRAWDMTMISPMLDPQNWVYANPWLCAEATVLHRMGWRMQSAGKPENSEFFRIYGFLPVAATKTLETELASRETKSTPSLRFPGRYHTRKIVHSLFFQGRARIQI